MSYTTNHPKIGEVEVLIEAEIDHANGLGATEGVVEGKKYFALVKSINRPFYDKHSRFSRFDYNTKWRSGHKIVKSYYVLWGNSSDFSEMGITHLLTPKLNTFKSTTTPVNIFFDMIKSSEFMTFINKK
jgi:hypothetical protein